MIIKQAEYITSCVKRDKYPNDSLPEFIFLGRSNVGKSSFINTLTNRKNLAYTSSKPGKTLTLNFFKINNSFFLIDVPGYGYAARSLDNRMDFGKMIEEYFRDCPNLRKCFLIVDIRHNPTEDDLLMYNYLLHYNIDVVVIATKADKLPKTKVHQYYKNIMNRLNISDPKLCIAFSKETKLGLDKVYEIIDDSLQ